MACRNTHAAETLKSEWLKKLPKLNLVVKELELSSFRSVKNFVDEIKATETQINYLINNAATWSQMRTIKMLTDDNIESHFQINFLSHFLITLLLLPRMIESAKKCGFPSRILFVVIFKKDIFSKC